MFFWLGGCVSLRWADIKNCISNRSLVFPTVLTRGGDCHHKADLRTTDCRLMKNRSTRIGHAWWGVIFTSALKKMTPSILLEIQGLRGIAIISVFLFHLWPNVFPNGYVGVDMSVTLSPNLVPLQILCHFWLFDGYDLFQTIIPFYQVHSRLLL